MIDSYVEVSSSVLLEHAREVLAYYNRLESEQRSQWESQSRLEKILFGKFVVTCDVRYEISRCRKLIHICEAASELSENGTVFVRGDMLSWIHQRMCLIESEKNS